DFTIALEPLWLPFGVYGFFVVRTFGLVLLTITFLLVFIAFMEAVLYLGQRNVDLRSTVAAFALTLVPIALVYNAAHNYSYVVVQSQYIVPLLNDPLQKGWHLWPAAASFSPSFALAQASTVWYPQIVLIVIGAFLIYRWYTTPLPLPTPAPDTAAALITGLTSLPASEFETVGQGSASSLIKPATGDVLTGASGKPQVLYVGGEFCPFCAAERWPLIIALSRFGTFTGLDATASSESIEFPNT